MFIHTIRLRPTARVRFALGWVIRPMGEKLERPLVVAKVLAVDEQLRVVEGGANGEATELGAVDGKAGMEVVWYVELYES